MDFIIELLFDFIIEGVIVFGSEKKVPMPLRILCLIVEWMIFFGLGGIFLYGGYDAFLKNDIFAAITLIVVGGFMFIGGIFIAYKMFKKKRAQEKESW